MKGLMSQFFLTCKRATELVEKQQTVGLTVLEYVRLKSHLGMCTTCAIYAVFSRKVAVLLKQLLHRESEQMQLNSSLKQRINDKIDSM
jgi:hypothetical protein